MIARAYMPKVFCAKCRAYVPYDGTSVVRVQQDKERYILVRHHGQEAKIGFVTDPTEEVTLWRE